MAHWRLVLVVVPIIGFVVASVCFFLRLLSRQLAPQKADIGDIFMGLGVLACCGVTICTILAAFHGVRRKKWTSAQEDLSVLILLFWLTQTIWPVSQTFVKLSIIMLLRQLLGTVVLPALSFSLLVAFTLAWGVTALFGNIFQCSPPRYFWLRYSVKGSCMSGQVTFYMITGALSLAEDILLLGLPIGVIWKLKMTRRRKIQVTSLFCLGGLTCVFSLLRLIEFNHYLMDSTAASGAKEALWTLLELDLAITCSSITLMRPLFTRAFLARLRSCTFRNCLSCNLLD